MPEHCRILPRRALLVSIPIVMCHQILDLYTLRKKCFDPWPVSHCCLEFIGAKVVCWRPHLAGTRLYGHTHRHGQMGPVVYPRLVALDVKIFAFQNLIKTDLFGLYLMNWTQVSLVLLDSEFFKDSPSTSNFV